MEMDVNQVQAALPHRYPFLLIDRIIALEPGARAVGMKNVTINEQFFNGHFPGRPMMPGVLVLEAMAQVGGVLLKASNAGAGRPAILAGMDRVRFRKPVLPGDQLIAEVQLLSLHTDFGKVRAIGRVEGEIVAEAEYQFVFIQRDANAVPASDAAPGVKR